MDISAKVQRSLHKLNHKEIQIAQGTNNLLPKTFQATLPDVKVGNLRPYDWNVTLVELHSCFGKEEWWAIESPYMFIWRKEKANKLKQTAFIFSKSSDLLSGYLNTPKCKSCCDFS